MNKGDLNCLIQTMNRRCDNQVQNEDLHEPI